MFTFAIDKERLLRHFQKDPVLFAYHIGDLDDRYFPLCQYAAIYGETAQILDSVLICNRLSTPSVLAFGMTDGFRKLLDDVVPVLPLRFFCHYQIQFREQFRQSFKETELGRHLKMRLSDFRPVESSLDTSKIVRLDRTHHNQLLTFYRAAYPDGYFEIPMLDTGKFLGYLVKGELLAVAGVHIYSPKYQIAVLGAIATHPNHRSQGLSTLLTSTLCREFIDEGMMVSLNVRADNAPAIRSYTSLGFAAVHEYQESLFEIDG
jgi:ribosomal protein S18 acetylase RimI-like enzyme